MVDTENQDITDYTIKLSSGERKLLSKETKEWLNKITQERKKGELSQSKLSISDSSTIFRRENR